MNRTEALEFAEAMIGRWTDQVKNERGYVHDKWKPVDLQERTEAVLKLAEFLLAQDQPQPPTNAVVSLVPQGRATLFGRPVEEVLEAPTADEVAMAKSMLAANAGKPVLAAEAEVLRRVAAWPHTPWPR